MTFPSVSLQRDYRDDRRGYRSGGHYRRQHSQEEEPEWFSGGPTSQNDTIELRGFETTPEERVHEEREQEQEERRDREREREREERREERQREQEGKYEIQALV